MERTKDETTDRLEGKTGAGSGAGRGISRSMALTDSGADLAVSGRAKWQKSSGMNSSSLRASVHRANNRVMTSVTMAVVRAFARNRRMARQSQRKLFLTERNYRWWYIPRRTTTCGIFRPFRSTRPPLVPTLLVPFPSTKTQENRPPSLLDAAICKCGRSMRQKGRSGF